MNKLECLYCNGGLELLPKDHPEAGRARITYDGTRKWFLCPDCKAVNIKDKVTGEWLLSPDTYARFVEKGLIKDVLED